MAMRYEPFNPHDKSHLSEGWHPAYVFGIKEEATPPKGKMAEHAPTMWRWYFWGVSV
jgi:hypothetical protein